MIDGCSEGWAGTGIPVCVLAASVAQQENNIARASRDGTLMKERDYIGLGLAAHEQGLFLQNANAQLAQDKMECDNVELSLGLGLPDKAAQQAAHVEQLASPATHPDHSESQAKLKLASPGAKTQHFWHHSFRENLSNDHHLQAEVSNGASLLKNYTSNVPAWGIVPGRFAIPIPKVSTVPAKRPYLETMGERRLLSTNTTHVAAGEAASHCPMPVPTATYAWNAEPLGGSASGGGSWQQVHVTIEQGSNHLMCSGASSAFAHSRQLAVLPPPPPPHFKVPQAGVSSPLPPTTNSSMAPNGSASSSQAMEVSAKPEIENENNRNKAPVVGWPPVRSFRKNTLQAAQSSRMSSEDLQTKSTVGPSNGGADGQELNGNNSKNAFFVKAKLDGVRICRKVDLKAYDSYDGLKSALQEMFQGFVSDIAKLDLLHGNNYVVTHEDKDGDCLLVGDVPWHMFVESSVKSLRIMKAMDAIGIGEKVSAKLKAQANGKP